MSNYQQPGQYGQMPPQQQQFGAYPNNQMQQQVHQQATATNQQGASDQREASGADGSTDSAGGTGNRSNRSNRRNQRTAKQPDDSQPGCSQTTAE